MIFPDTDVLLDIAWQREPSWDRLVTSDKSEVLEDIVFVFQLQKYYKQYDYLLEHFSQLPFKARERYRELISENILSSDLESVQLEWGAMGYTDNSTRRMKE